MCYLFFSYLFLFQIELLRMGEFGMLVLNNGTNILGFGIPFLLFVVGKIRRKI